MSTKKLNILILKGNQIPNLGNEHFSWTIVAKINSSSDSNARLIHQTEAVIDSTGKAVFENLGVSSAMSNFTVEFYLKTPIGVNS